MRIDNAGRCLYTETEAFNLIMQGIDIDDINIENDVKLNELVKNYDIEDFKSYMAIEDEDVESFHRMNLSDWKMPDAYYKMDIVNYLRDCAAVMSDTRYHKRLEYELAKFEEYNLLDLLRYMKYMMDTFVEHGIVWGIGRGSSVASLCLYYIGVHRVDPVAYEIDFEEFLK